MWETSTLRTLANEDLGTLAEYDPLTLLAHVYLGCIQRECKPNETIIEQFTKIFESGISARATEKLPGCDKPCAKTSSWSHDRE